MIRDYIFSNVEIIEGSDVYLNCPICNKNGKFSVSVKDGYILYNCFSSSCGTRGKLTLKLSSEEKLQYLKNRKEKIERTLPYVVPSYWIDGIGNGDCLKYMIDKHMFDAYKKGLFRPMYDPAERRFIFPIRSDSGAVIGAVGRSMAGTLPKALNYNRTYLKPFMCGRGEIAILVEDCASAVAVTRKEGLVGVALQGTHLREDFIPHLSPFKWVGIALDPDAYNKSSKVKKSLTSYIKDVRILKLPKDIKDMSDSEYETFIEKYVT